MHSMTSQTTTILHDATSDFSIDVTEWLTPYDLRRTETLRMVGDGLPATTWWDEVPWGAWLCRNCRVARLPHKTKCIDLVSFC